ncbi:unnamed protein product, partial [Ixodes pacificus]
VALLLVLGGGHDRVCLVVVLVALHLYGQGAGGPTLALLAQCEHSGAVLSQQPVALPQGQLAAQHGAGHVRRAAQLVQGPTRCMRTWPSIGSNLEASYSVFEGTLRRGLLYQSPFISLA